MAKKKRRRRRRKKVTSWGDRARVAGTTAGYAYLKEQSKFGPTMMKIPTVDAIGYDATMAIFAHYAAKHGPRFARKYLDALATGLLGKEGYDFGAAGFKLKGVSGGGVLGGKAGVGEMDPDQFDDDDDLDDDD